MSLVILQKLKFINQYNTYIIVLYFVNHKVIESKFAFKLKNVEISNSKFKARLVVKEYSQILHVNYEKTFTFVLKAILACLFLTYIAENALFINQFNVEITFFNFIIDHILYMKQSFDYEDSNHLCKNYILLVNKELYDLKQVKNLYVVDQKQKLINLDFTFSESNKCVFISANKRIIIEIYVDNKLILVDTQDEIN
jgi:Reverse transcriptase (RNA-dependent DNA polymerase)